MEPSLKFSLKKEKKNCPKFPVNVYFWLVGLT